MLAPSWRPASPKITLGNILHGRLCLVCTLLAAADLHPSLRAPFSSMIPFALAISNVATFGATYLASLSWRANPDLIKRVREAVGARGRPGELINRYVIPVALALWGLASIFLTIALFGTLKLGLGHAIGYGSLFASIGENAVFLQMLLALNRSAGGIRPAERNGILFKNCSTARCRYAVPNNLKIEVPVNRRVIQTSK